MTSATGVKVIESVDDLRKWRKTTAGAQGIKIGFVPTMGALHEGHLTLIRKAAAECQSVVVSIFVNPLQFGPNEDFSRYPRSFEKDLEMCAQAGAHVVFHPSVDQMYRSGLGSTTKVVPPPELTERLCGLFRPGHFVGVATVVLKLFSMVEPHAAYFGEKDFQQLTIIQRMVDDLDLPLTIVPVATVRETDGLAMSSRNTYLTSEQRKISSELYKVLNQIKDDCSETNKSLREAEAAGQAHLNSLPDLHVQYLEACDPKTLEPRFEWKTPIVILVAAKLGNVRLIDNLLVH